MANIGIIGAGSWGIALSYLLHNNGHQVTVWSALPQEVEELREKRVHRTLPDLTLPEDMVFTGDLEVAMDQKDLLVTAVPSVYVRETAKKMRPFLREGQIVVNVAKGIEEGTLMTLSQILEEELPGANVAVLSGPSHAEEVSRSLPTTCVAGAADKKTAEYIQSLFMSEVFRVYTSPDVLGIELGGALKNVIALAAGIAGGLGYGDNARAAIITRGIAEMARLGAAMGCPKETFSGLTGLGDLVVTCTSMHSRNNRCGMLIGQGKAPDEAVREVGMVVEGLNALPAALKLGKKYGVELPIIEGVHGIVDLGVSPREMVAELMRREPKPENWI